MSRQTFLGDKPFIMAGHLERNAGDLKGPLIALNDPFESPQEAADMLMSQAGRDSQIYAVRITPVRNGYAAENVSDDVVALMEAAGAEWFEEDDPETPTAWKPWSGGVSFIIDRWSDGTLGAGSDGYADPRDADIIARTARSARISAKGRPHVEEQALLHVPADFSAVTARPAGETLRLTGAEIRAVSGAAPNATISGLSEDVARAWRLHPRRLQNLAAAELDNPKPD